MDTTATIFLVGLLAGFGLLQLRDRRRMEPGSKQPPTGWWTVLRSPKLLVAPIAAVLLTAGLHKTDTLRLEMLHPGLYGTDWISEGWFTGQLLSVALGSILLAGFVGQLDARSAGRTPDADAFIAGIRNHSLAILLARCLVEVWLIPAHALIGGRADFWLILYQAPSLILAPVFAATARHPGRPIAALRETLEMARAQMYAVAPIFAIQALLLSGLWLGMERILRGRVFLGEFHGESLFPLAMEGSALGFNDASLMSMANQLRNFCLYPEASLPAAAVILGCLAGPLISAVCISRYHALQRLPRPWHTA